MLPPQQRHAPACAPDGGRAGGWGCAPGCGVLQVSNRDAPGSSRRCTLHTEMDDGPARAATAILREVHSLYTAPATGLEAVSAAVGLSPALLAPSRRVTAMVVGNHSAGKSSFINWYTGTAALPTGVAVETQGFTLVRCGLHAADVRGEGAVLDHPHLAAVVRRLPRRDTARFMEGLSLLVRPAGPRSHDFARVDLIDTPVRGCG